MDSWWDSIFFFHLFLIFHISWKYSISVDSVLFRKFISLSVLSNSAFTQFCNVIKKKLKKTLSKTLQNTHYTCQQPLMMTYEGAWDNFGKLIRLFKPSPFPKKGELGLAKNCRGITLTSIYNALLHNRIEPKIENILWKNQNGFRRNRSTTSQILTIRRILEGVRAKNLEATILFVDFTKAFDTIHRGKMEQTLLAYGLPKETVAATMMLHRNTKVKVRFPDGDTEDFDLLLSDTLTPYLFIICLDYMLRTSIDKIKVNGFKLTKERSRRYPTQTITDANYTDDIALLANAPAQAETLLNSLERAAAGISLHVNAHKTEYMCFTQTGDISTPNCSSLKLVDKFTYLRSSVSSNETDINTRMTKAWTAMVGYRTYGSQAWPIK